jgi:iduronate 2-sulfatase
MLSVVLLLLSSVTLSSAKDNLLFIIVDDLRAQAGGPFGQSTLTPNLNALSARGVAFTRAYVQVSLCSPSRTSMLTGRRPDRTKLWTIGPYFRDTTRDAHNISTLPQTLKAQGWNASGAGKVWHPGTSSGGEPSWGGGGVGGDDQPYSWSDFVPAGVDSRVVFWECDAWMNSTGQSAASAGVPGGAGCVTSPACVACLQAHNGTDGHAVAVTPCADDCYVDNLVSARAAAALRARAASGEAFAFFAGFKRPHLGFQVPQHAFDLYAPGQPIAADRAPPAGMPPAGWWRNGEMDGLPDVRPFVLPSAPSAPFPGRVNDTAHALLRRAYYASVSWMDSQLGLLLAALDAAGLAETTWVVFVGDHGWSLGEHGNWAKQQLFEHALRVPLVFAPPRGRAGWRTNATVGAADGAFVEALDIYPTIAELLGARAEGLQGRSLAPFLRAPGARAAVANVSGALSQVVRADRPCAPPAAARTPRPARGDSDPPRAPAPPDAPPCLMGLSLRARGYRYTAWLNFSYAGAGALWDELEGEELYDHTVADAVPASAGAPDPGLDYDDASESVNVAADPHYAAVKEQLKAMLRAGFPPLEY